MAVDLMLNDNQQTNQSTLSSAQSLPSTFSVLKFKKYILHTNTLLLQKKIHLLLHTLLLALKAPINKKEMKFKYLMSSTGNMDVDVTPFPWSLKIMFTLLSYKCTKSHGVFSDIYRIKAAMKVQGKGYGV